MNFADEIKSQLTAAEVFTVYGFQPNKRGFVCCPFHGEKTASMKLYDGQRGWYCFGCHKGGDVIDFVREYFSLPFSAALAKINDDFGLRLPIGQPRTARQQLEDARAALERKRRTERRKAERKRLDDEYWAAYDEWKRIDDNLQDYRPKHPDDEWHPLFVEAVSKKDAALYALDVADSRRREYDRSDDNPRS